MRLKLFRRRSSHLFNFQELKIKGLTGLIFDVLYQ